MNRVVDDIKAKEFAKGTHSSIGSPRKSIIKGIIIPPPPNPPALAIIFINAIAKSPPISEPAMGKFNAFRLISHSSSSPKVES